MSAAIAPTQSSTVNDKHTTAALHAAVESEVEQWVDLANKALSADVPYPSVTFRKSGTRAGAVFVHQARVNFNRVLLAAHPKDYFDDVIPHEVAHWVVHTIFGRVKPHGREWQHIMRHIFNRAPQTTHSLDTKVLNRKTFAYRCGCTTHDLSVRRHNAIQNDKRRYLCRKCGEELTASAA